MKVRIRHHGEVSLVELSGRLTIGEDAQLREAVLALLKEGRTRIVVNLKGVPWIDSGGIGELVACQKRAREAGGVVKLLSPTSRVWGVFVGTWLDRVFQKFDDERDALGSF